MILFLLNSHGLYLCFIRPLSEDEARVHTPVVISCNENRREVCAIQNIANKQIDRTFNFDKVRNIFSCLLVFVARINLGNIKEYKKKEVKILFSDMAYSLNNRQLLKGCLNNMVPGVH